MFTWYQVILYLFLNMCYFHVLFAFVLKQKLIEFYYYFCVSYFSKIFSETAHNIGKKYWNIIVKKTPSKKETTYFFFDFLL